MSPYWSFYEKTEPKAVKNGLKAKSKRGSIGETWWSKRWVAVLESFKLGARLTRGRSYARKGQVISIDVQPGMVRAKVQGTFPDPYDVSIKLKPLSHAEWTKAVQAMASKAVFSVRLLSGEMPQNIEEAFSDSGVSLFPKKGADLKTDCSCPDWSNPCKHIAAVYYLLAEEFDRDPFLIFRLRGRTREELVEELRAIRSAGAEEDSGSIPFPAGSTPGRAEPLRDCVNCLDCFWQKGSKLDLLPINPKAPEVDNAILKRLGDAPFTIGKSNLAALLPAAYEIAGKRSLLRATEEKTGRKPE
ncbi:MAG: SWIM zinc finger family protein [Methanotrichaceae archaeon]|nr:SWIM zinc finger family protein [Methanotrichaceae archaeon]